MLELELEQEVDLMVQVMIRWLRGVGRVCRWRVAWGFWRSSV